MTENYHADLIRAERLLLVYSSLRLIGGEEKNYAVLDNHVLEYLREKGLWRKEP